MASVEREEHDEPIRLPSDKTLRHAAKLASH